MKLTEKKLRSLDPCTGLDWYMAQKETDLKVICTTLFKENLTMWANWLLSRLMTKRQRVGFVFYAAEQVVRIFEAEYPKDSRPRDAIKAAKRYLKKPTDKNKKAAAVAAVAARAAAREADAAARAARDDAYFDDAVVDAASAAANAVDTSYSVTEADRKSIQLKIIKYGLKILAEKKKGKK